MAPGDRLWFQPCLCIWVMRWCFCAPRAHRGGVAPAVSLPRVRLLWRGPAPPLHAPVNNGPSVAGPGSVCVHPQLRHVPHPSPFRLSLCRQLQSTPWACLLKLKFPHPVTSCTSRHASWPGECSGVAWVASAGFVLPATGRLADSPLSL